MEDIKIDLEELEKQQEIKIKESGHYIEIKLVMGEETKEPICRLNIHGASTIKTAEAITSLKVLIKKMIETNPMAGVIAGTMGAKGICIDGKTNKVDEIIEI